MIKNQIKAGIIFGISTFLTIFICFIGYAAITNIWTNTDTLEVSSGSTLSATSWNKLLGNFEFLKSRTEGISSSAGKIGIGTDTPEQTLHLKTSGTSAQLVLERYNTSVGKMAIGADNYGFNIYDTPSYTRRLTVTSSGNVGIGITNPNLGLVVNSDDGTAYNRIARFQSPDGGSIQIGGDAFGNGNNNSWLSSPSGILFDGTGNTGNSQLYLKSDGNVGIGTNNPNVKLSVNGGIQFCGGPLGSSGKVTLSSYSSTVCPAGWVKIFEQSGYSLCGKIETGCP